MAKKSLIQRDIKRLKLNQKYKKLRKDLLFEYFQLQNLDLKFKIHNQIQQLPRDSSATRYRNRCLKTGRPRGYYRDFGISRQILREMAHQGLLPGITKSSW